MGRLLDATALQPVSLPLIRYTVHPYGQEVDAWPPALDELLHTEAAVSGWEVWCWSMEMRR